MTIRVCSMCGQVYGPEYADTFCVCGFELVLEKGATPVAEPEKPAVVPAAGSNHPPPGTHCLVLYGPEKQPVHYFPLTKDMTLIGRQDPVEGTFPDIDLTEWLDPASRRRVSRQHAVILHSRQDGSFLLRPLPGNTGTQLEADMLAPQQDMPLKPGQRLILGGAVRLKFEIA